MDVILIVVLFAGGSWLVFSVFGYLTGSRPTSKFGAPLGNPEVVDYAVKKIYKKIRGPKKFTIEEIEKINKLVNEIEKLESTLENLRLESTRLESRVSTNNIFIDYDLKELIRRKKLDLSILISDF